MDGHGCIKIRLGGTGGDGHRQSLDDLACESGPTMCTPTTLSSAPFTRSFISVRSERPVRVCFMGRNRGFVNHQVRITLPGFLFRGAYRTDIRLAEHGGGHVVVIHLAVFRYR